MPDEDTTVHAVLLVPAEGDPHDLLREGPCGSRPPTAGLWKRLDDVGDSTGEEVWAHANPGGDDWIDWGYQENVNALVLAWGGVPVAEGTCRLMQRVADSLDPDGGQEWAMPRGSPSAVMRHVVAGTRQAVSDGFGTVVFLDVDGCEVTDADR